MAFFAPVPLPEVRFHDLSRTCAALALQNSVEVKTVSNHLGHATAAFSMDKYVYLSMAMQGRCDAGMESFMASLQPVVALWRHKGQRCLENQELRQRSRKDFISWASAGDAAYTVNRRASACWGFQLRASSREKRIKKGRQKRTCSLSARPLGFPCVQSAGRAVMPRCPGGVF